MTILFGFIIDFCIFVEGILFVQFLLDKLLRLRLTTRLVVTILNRKYCVYKSRPANLAVSKSAGVSKAPNTYIYYGVGPTYAFQTLGTER
jgi:hypothetical protein